MNFQRVPRVICKVDLYVCSSTYIGSSFCVHKGRARGGGDAIFVCLVGLFYIVWPETTWSSVQLIYVPWEVQRCLTFSCFPFIWSKGFSTKSQSIYGSAQRSGNACSLAKEEGFFGTSKFFSLLVVGPKSMDIRIQFQLVLLLDRKWNVISFNIKRGGKW